MPVGCKRWVSFNSLVVDLFLRFLLVQLVQYLEASAVMNGLLQSWTSRFVQNDLVCLNMGYPQFYVLLLNREDYGKQLHFGTKPHNTAWFIGGLMIHGTYGNFNWL